MEKLEKELADTQTNPIKFSNTQEQIRLVRHELNQLHKLKRKGAIVRSRYRFARDGERPTKYYLNLEKRKSRARTLHRIKVKDKIVDEPKQVLSQIKVFYQQLYSTDLKYLNKLNLPQLSESERDMLDEPITMSEISWALKNMANDKAPGTDGLSVNFYKTFWSRLKGVFFDLVTEIVEDGQFHLTARYGILSLLEKIGKDSLILKNWRPLTLLNVDNKIYSKVLANRMPKVLPSIIHHMQNGFMKGRQMTENVMKLIQVMHFCEQDSQNALLVSFDFEKAFDMVEWQALYKAMEAFNFGDRFIEMTKILFNKPLVCASNNGYWTEFFTPTRGCRQGCCFSPSGFNIIAEIIGSAIRQNPSIKGIKIGNTEVVSGQFADDLWTLLFPTANNLNEVLQELESFARYSGLRINSEKCAVLKIGPFRDTDVKFYTLKKLYWSPGPIRILGMCIHPDWQLMYHDNFVESLDKVKGIIGSWSNWSQTLVGKITVVNSLINTLFTHKF